MWPSPKSCHTDCVNVWVCICVYVVYVVYLCVFVGTSFYQSAVLFHTRTRTCTHMHAYTLTNIWDWWDIIGKVATLDSVPSRIVQSLNSRYVPAPYNTRLKHAHTHTHTRTYTYTYTRSNHKGLYGLLQIRPKAIFLKFKKVKFSEGYVMSLNYVV